MPHNQNELISAAANGCTTSFERLIGPVENKMLSVAAGLASSPDEADDIFQDAMINAYKALPKFRKDSQFATWLYRIVVNAALTHRRKLKSQLKYFVSNSVSKNLEGTNEQQYELYSTGQTNEAELQNQQLSQAINRALAKLPETEKIAFVLCHQQGLKISDASGVMQCTEGAIKNFLFRARSKMREQLKEFIG